MKTSLTLDDIERKIKGKRFTVLEDGRTTICNIYLENGFTVRGESACVNPENYDEEIGKRISFENAKKKIWALEGYLLQERIYQNKLKEGKLNELR